MAQHDQNEAVISQSVANVIVFGLKKVKWKYVFKQKLDTLIVNVVGLVWYCCVHGTSFYHIRLSALVNLYVLSVELIGQQQQSIFYMSHHL